MTVFNASSVTIYSILITFFRLNTQLPITNLNYLKTGTNVNIKRSLKHHILGVSVGDG